ICFDDWAVGNQHDSSRLFSRSYFIGEYCFAIPPRDSLERSGLIWHSPRYVQLIATLSFCSEGLAVQKHLDLVAVGIGPNIYRVALFPILMRQNVEYRLVGPFAPVHVIRVFRKSSKIDDPKV